MKGFDVACPTPLYAEKLTTLVRPEYGAIGLYLRSDRCSKVLVEHLLKEGFGLWFVYERGYPTSPAYFTLAQAEKDASAAVSFAHLIGLPKGKEIFMAVDFDAANYDICRSIRDYQARAQAIVKSRGYLASVYGSGDVCSYLVGRGLAHSGWLAGAVKWGGYSHFLPQASIVQGREVQLHGMDVDLNAIQKPEVLWSR